MTYTANQKNLASYVSYNPPQRNAIVKKVGIYGSNAEGRRLTYKSWLMFTHCPTNGAGFNRALWHRS
jgi:hypothetical protein